MTESDLRGEDAALRDEKEALRRGAVEVERAIAALAQFEVGVATREASGTPVLLPSAQETLRRSEQLLRGVFDGALDAMLLVDDGGQFVDANPTACAIVQLPRGELIGRSIAKFTSPDYDSNAAYRTLRAQRQMRGHFPLRRLDGTERTLDFSARANVVPGLHLTVFRDITDQLAAADAVRRSDAQFRAVIEKSSEVISLTAADGTTRYLTPLAWQLLGWTPEELGDRPLRDLVVPEDRVRIASEIERLVRTGTRDISLEFRVQRRDGSIGWVESTGTNMLADPDVAAIVGNYRDISAREAADEALRNSRDQLEAAQALAHVGSRTSGLAQDEEVHWTRECCRIFGVPEDTTITVASLFSRVHPADGGAQRDAEHGALVHGVPIDLEYRVERPDGRPCWVHVKATVEHAAHGPSRMVGTVQDITERRLATEALKASEARYRRIVETTSDGIWICTPDGVTTFMNRRMAEMLYCTVDEAVGKSALLFMDPSDHAGVDARLARRLHGVAERLDILLRCKDGAGLLASVQATPMLDADGNLEAVLAVVADISAQRRAAIVESSEDAIIGTGLDWNIVSWNAGAEGLYQYSREEMVGKPALLLVPPKRIEEWRQLLESLARGSTVRPYETERRRKDGSTVEVAIAVSPILDAGGTRVGFSIMARDLTTRRRTEATLRRTEDQFRQVQKMEAVGRLAGGIAHDLNNLLSVIASYTELMVEELKVDDPMRDDLAQLLSASQRATELTRQLLAFSRQQVRQPQVLDVNRVLADIQKMLERLLGEDIELSLVTAGDLGRVLADPGQIDQVVVNLAVNARDAMPEGGKITIETANIELDATYVGEQLDFIAGDYVMLALSDTGIGMDAATQARIFEPFFTTKAPGKGTGLGLATVFGIVQQSGGQIGVCREVGRGTTFKMYIPRTDRALEPASVEAPPTHLRSSETILLVEDEAQVRAVACVILRRNGYHVLEAASGGEALLVSRAFGAKIHLLLTDVVMPHMSGRRVMDHLAPERPEMRVLFASSYTDDAIVHHGVLNADVPFLQKPFTPDALLRKVREVLDGPMRRVPFFHAQNTPGGERHE